MNKLSCILSTLTLVALAAVSTFSVSAEAVNTVEESGISATISADKESYSAGDEINFNIKIDNNKIKTQIFQRHSGLHFFRWSYSGKR